MSLSRARWAKYRSSGRRHLLVAACCALVLPLVSACGNDTTGFRPLHGPTASGENLSVKLRQIDVKKIPGRVGQRIRNELIYETTGSGSDEHEHLYDLLIVTRESVTSTLVQRSGESLGQVYNLDVNFKLIDRKSKKIILEGKSYSRAGYERFTSIYANVRAQQNAENRAAKTVAQEIRGRLAAFLASRA